MSGHLRETSCISWIGDLRAGLNNAVAVRIPQFLSIGETISI
ncbi:MAG: hypothetical protein VXW84_04810 [Verrucomicrobiota bacterium]|nr:hypothetical protein [Verrucomicrobiota bacterium]